MTIEPCQWAPSSDHIRSWFRSENISPDRITHYFNIWRDDSYSVVYENTLSGDKFDVPVVKRGTKDYYRRNYAKFMRYLDE